MKWLHPRFTQVSWQFRDHNTKRDCPSSWQKCLENPLSLTKRVETFFKIPVQICVLKEGWQQAEKTRGRRCVWLREVLMVSGEVPLLFARTTIPLKAAQGRLRLVRKLGDRALGKLLYAEPSLRRTTIKIYPLHDHLWGRSSTFLFVGARLYLEEYFLSPLLARLL